MAPRLSLWRLKSCDQCFSSTPFCPNAVLGNVSQTARLRSFTTATPKSNNRMAKFHRNRLLFAGLSLATAVAIGAQHQFARKNLRRLDAPSQEPLTSAVKVEVTGQDHNQQVDRAPTGTEKIPYFPKTIWLPRVGGLTTEGKSAALPAGIGPAREEEEYHLMGVGIRTVSFLSIQVYVVGWYVAQGDLAQLQQALVQASVPEGSNASTLVQGEKEELRQRLLDGPESEKIWSKILKEKGLRSAIRIVPTRDTNFGHLRDGWLRGIDLRGKSPEFQDEAFKESVGEFKSIMGGRGSVGKGRVMLLGRGTTGDLRAWVEEGAATAGQGEQNLHVLKGDRLSLLGRVEDERVSRLVWMGYLAGKRVASEPARASVIDGVLEVVERPYGSIETQVV